MIVTPSININNEKQVEELLPKLKLLQENKKLNNLHIDITDGKFASPATYFSPIWFLEKFGKDFNFFVHFMVEKLEKHLEEWQYLPNFKKISFHLKSHFDVDNLIHFSREHNIALEIVYSLNDNFYEFLEMVLFYNCNSVQFLAVPPGPSGQKFDYSVLEKIKIFKAQYPHIETFVDGGVNDKNIADIKAAGANGVVVGSYLWQSDDPLKAFDLLNI